MSQLTITPRFAVGEISAEIERTNQYTIAALARHKQEGLELAVRALGCVAGCRDTVAVPQFSNRSVVHPFSVGIDRVEWLGFAACWPCWPLAIRVTFHIPGRGADHLCTHWSEPVAC